MHHTEKIILLDPKQSELTPREVQNLFYIASLVYKNSGLKPVEKKEISLLKSAFILEIEALKKLLAEI